MCNRSCCNVVTQKWSNAPLQNVPLVLSQCELERSITSCVIFCLLGLAVKVNRLAFDSYGVNINQTILIRKKKGAKQFKH